MNIYLLQLIRKQINKEKIRLTIKCHTCALSYNLSTKRHFYFMLNIKVMLSNVKLFKISVATEYAWSYI